MARRMLLGRLRRSLERMTVHEFQFADARVRVYELWTMSPQEAERVDLTNFVLVHGLGVSSRFFVPLAHELAPYGRVLLFDLPGFHDLPKPKHRMSIVDFADVVKRALDELQVIDPLLVGHSMGAQVVTEILAEYPDYCSAAMLIGPVVVPDERHLRAILVRFVQSAVFEPPGNLLSALTSYARAGFRWINDTAPKVLAYPIEERLPLARARLLLIAGNYDRISPAWWRAELAAALPGTQHITLPHASHGIVHDEFRALADELVALAGIGTA